MRKTYTILYIFMLLMVCLSSCSTTKYVPDGNYLLDKTEIKVEENVVGSNSLTPYLRQRPNFKVFGAFRLRLGIYNLSGRDTSKRINRRLKAIGEPPVIYDPFQTYRSEKELEKHIHAKGYLSARVNSSVSFRKKKAKVTYFVTPDKPYRINHISYNFESDKKIDSLLRNGIMDQTKLKEDMLFDSEALDEERDRITIALKRRGYFYFSKDYINYTADTTVGNRKVDLTVHVKPFVQTSSHGYTEEMAHPQYTVRDIRVTTLKNSQIAIDPKISYDTLLYKPHFQVVSFGKPLLRPSVLESEVRIKPGQLYNEFITSRTYSKLNMLGIIRSSNIRYTDAQTEKKELDCDILLIPAKTQSISFDVEGTNSSGDLGFALNLGYQHKNVFRGSELLGAKIRYAQEAYSGQSGLGSFSDIIHRHVLDWGGELSLNIPRFLFPFTHSLFKRQVNANTEYRLSYNYQVRPNTYERNSIATGMRYIWNMRRYYKYTLDLIDMTYNKIATAPSFDSIYSASKYSVLRESYSDHFVMSAGFAVQYDNQAMKNRRNKTYYRFSVESAGNLLYGISHLAHRSQNEDGFFEIGNIPYSQYVKGEADYSYNQEIDSRNHIVYHVALGIAFPYGNAAVTPFEKRFFGGGANGVRGWSVRTLGPGIYSSESYDDFVKQSGDIKLLMNLEYRAKLVWKLELAAFLDAGNIWTIKDYESQPYGQFQFDKFYKQIAMAYGLGLRFDFSYFLVRFDMGVKLYDPSRISRTHTLPDNSMEVINYGHKWRFKGLNWKDDFAMHFAIGYPF